MPPAKSAPTPEALPPPASPETTAAETVALPCRPSSTLPPACAADNVGQLFVADSGNNIIRQISTTTYVSTLAGGAATACTTQTTLGKPDTFGNGCSALSAIFLNPTSLAFDATGQNLLVADTGHHSVRNISLNNRLNITGSLATSVLVNPVTLVAGDGQPGASVDVNSTATLSELNMPSGVAVDAASNVYIADTGNSAIRLVNSATGSISTIVGIATAPGTGKVPGSAVATQLSLPADLAVSPTGTLVILDSGNNRVLSDVRSQVSYDFGRTNVPGSSPVQNFVELNIGVTSTPIGSTVFTGTGDTGQFTLAPHTSPNGVIGACATSLAPGAVCNIQGQFTPTGTNPYNAVYTENGTTTIGAAPSITLLGLGAILTKTTSTVAQTTPSTGNSQFGGSLTLTGTVTPASCNLRGSQLLPNRHGFLRPRRDGDRWCNAGRQRHGVAGAAGPFRR